MMLEVHSYGNIDFLKEIFTAVTGLLGDSSFGTLWRLTAILGMLAAAYQLFFSFKMEIIGMGIIRQYITIAAIFYTLFVPKADVTIYDEILNTQVVVNRVPFGISLLANFFTTAEKGITETIETYFSTPSDLRFSQSGYAFSTMMLNTMKDAHVADQYFTMEMDGYIYNCFFNDILLGAQDENAVVNSNDLLTAIAPQAVNNYQAFIFTKNNPTGQQSTCQNVYADINTRIGPQINQGIAQLNKIIGVDVASRLPDTMQMAVGVSMDAITTLQQALIANSMQTGIAQASMYSGVSGDALLYATTLAQQQQQTSWTVSGQLAQQYIPILRQILEAMIYGLFPMLFLMMMTPMAVKALKLYFTLMIWLLCWSPLYAILNLIVNARLTGVLSAATGTFSLGNMPYIYSSANQLTAIAGYIAWMVPTIAFAIASGSNYALTHIASGLQSSTNLSTHQAAGAVTGTEGAKRMADTAATFKYAQVHGTAGVAQAMMANSYYGMAFGGAQDERGPATLEGIANNTVGQQAGNYSAAQSAMQAFGLPSYDAYHDWQQRGSQAADVLPALQSQGFVTQQAAQQFGLGGASVSGQTFSSDGQLSSVSLHKSGGGGDVTASGNRIDWKTAVTDQNIAQLKGDLNAAGMNRVADAIQPGMDYHGTYDKDGKLMATDLSKGGKLVDSDSVYREGMNTQQFSTDQLNIKAQDGNEINLSNATYSSQGGVGIATGFTADGKLGTYTIESPKGLSADSNSHFGQAEGRAVKATEESGLSNNSTVSKAQLLEYAQKAHDAGDFASEKEFRSLAAQGKDAYVQEHKGLFSKAYASISAASGANVRHSDIGTSEAKTGQYFSGPLSKDDAAALRAEMAKDPNFKTGAQFVKPGMQADIVRGNDGKLASAVLSRGAKVAYNSQVNGVNSVDTGRHNVKHDEQFTNIDHMNKEKTGGTEGTWITPQGTFTGHKVWDAARQQNVIVDGQNRYAVGEDVVRQQPETTIQVKGTDGKIHDMKLPNGYVHEVATRDPKTGTAVDGKTSSIHMTEGEVKTGDGTYNAQISTDMRTGNQLAVHGESGRYWTKTYNEDSWTIHRDMNAQGQVFGSWAAKWFGPDAGKYVADFTQGVGEAGTVKRVLQKTATPEEKPPRPQGDYSKWPREHPPVKEEN